MTTNEKAVLENARRRATFLGINFGSKVLRKKYEQFLIDDKVFSRHYAIRLLYDSDKKLDKKIGKQYENEYNVLNIHSLTTKIKLIKQLSEILGLDAFDIDTQRDIDRFDEDVNISDDLREMIKKIFRCSRKNLDKNKFEQ